MRFCAAVHPLDKYIDPRKYLWPEAMQDSCESGSFLVVPLEVVPAKCKENLLTIADAGELFK